MKIINKEAYRSEDRKVNQSDDMVKLTVTMTLNEYYNLINKGILREE